MRSIRNLWAVPVAFLLVGASCGTASVEPESNATAGSNADLTTENINGTIVTTGSDVAVPSDFPKDVYVLPGTMVRTSRTPGQGWTITTTTTRAISDVKAVFEQKIQAAGWVIATSGIVGQEASIIAEKDTREVSISIDGTTAPTTVVVTVTLTAVSIPTNANLAPGE